MKNKLNLDWFIAAGIRALRTVAQTALGMFTVGAAMDEVQWKYVISVSLVAGIYSMLTSFATKLPEVSTDGVLKIDTSDDMKDIYLLALDTEFDTLKNMKYITLKVDPNAKLQPSQE